MMEQLKLRSCRALNSERLPRFEERSLSSVVYRFGAAGAALAVFLAMSWLYAYDNKELYETILKTYGVLPFKFPFVDISGSLAAWECARQGVDVILSNPCDVLQRGYNYSPLWMAVSRIPLGTADTMVVGWSIDLVFLLSLSLLPPPRRPFELVLVLAASLSTMVFFALERANPDLLMFLLALAAVFLTECRLFLRLFGYFLALIAALVKYYPLVIFIIACRERAAILCLIALVIMGSFAVFVLEYQVELARGLPTIARGPYNTDLFSAQNLPFLIGEATGNAAASSLVGRIAAGGLYAILLAACIALWLRLLRFSELRAALTSLPRLERALLVTGSAVIAGCFFAGQSIGYRGIFLLLVMPGLLALSRSGARELRALCLGSAIVIVLLMWGECLRQALDGGFGFWLLRELGWWWSVSVMLALVADFLRELPVLRSASAWFGRQPVRSR